MKRQVYMTRLMRARHRIGGAARRKGVSFTKLVTLHIGQRKLTAKRAEQIADFEDARWRKRRAARASLNAGGGDDV